MTIMESRGKEIETLYNVLPKRVMQSSNLGEVFLREGFNTMTQSR